MKDYLTADSTAITATEVKRECPIVPAGDHGLGICFNDYNCHGSLQARTIDGISH